MSLITSGWRKCIVYNPLTGDRVQLNKIATDQSEYQNDVIKTESTDGVVYGGIHKRAVVGFFDDAGLDLLEQWMDEGIHVCMFIQSRGKNIAWYEPETITVERGVATNARDGAQIHALEIEAVGHGLEVYEFQNLLKLPLGIDNSGKRDMNIVMPLSGVDLTIGGRADGGSITMTVTVKDFDGNPLQSITETNTSGAPIVFNTAKINTGAYNLDVVFESATGTIEDIVLRLDNVEKYSEA